MLLFTLTKIGNFIHDVCENLIFAHNTNLMGAYPRKLKKGGFGFFVTDMDWSKCIICGKAGGDLRCPVDSHQKNEQGVSSLMEETHYLLLVRV